MHQLIASPYEDEHLVLRPGSSKAVKIPQGHFAVLEHASVVGEPCPDWLVKVAAKAWGLNLDGRPVAGNVLVRKRGATGHSRATYEINLGCDFDCPECYLGPKLFEGLGWDDKIRMLYAVRDSGVIWFQFTGGEPLIDPDFKPAYRLATELGMMVEILSNGSRLGQPEMIELFRELPPEKITLSMYGATPETYEKATRKPHAFKKFSEGLNVAVEAGLNLHLSLIIIKENAHEQDAMRAWAERLGVPWSEYALMSPTIAGGAEPLANQSPIHLKDREPFTGCPAGHTFYHLNPFGRASICKVGRDPSISLVDDGVAALNQLGGIADNLMLRTGGCSGCQLSGSCRVCRPMAKLMQEAKAPLRNYCQHG
ncbi:radical SAM protein [Streptomyces antarcticus]|uniref:radical SAM protein n=1 Tax=Streptomyces antarcticus TaxID=2996458 RepID=UPI00226DDEFE|nr:radical SAM protein [Streptomyces sp. H34-AA3]MCY0945344.1 radical SAM protein [Streptomyces sp. H34-AA3]